MTVDRASFKARFPEFEPASDIMIDAAIVDAIEDVAADIFTTKTDHAVMLLTAHNLASHPNAQQARLVDKVGSSTYLVQYQKIERSVTIGGLVVI